MKKFAIMAAAICAAFIMAAPAMAIDADFSGEYRVRGFYDSHYDLRDNASNAYMNMCLELDTVFKVTDNLSLTTKIMGLEDKNWGTTDDYGNDLDLNHVYMTIKTDFGKFDIGRMLGGPLGNDFADFEYEADRIKYTKVIDDFKVVAIFQKAVEGDSPSTAIADGDKDDYYLVGMYNAEDIAAGLGYTFMNDKRASNATSRYHLLDPYFNAKFGPLALQGELFYKFGKTEYDNPALDDLDKDAIAYNLEATYDLGMASVMAGYAFFSGDKDGNTDHEDSGFEYGVGDNWRRLFILTSDEDPVLCENLGGVGNLSTEGGASAYIPGDRITRTGAKIYYAGASFIPMENLQLGLVLGLADADEVPAGWKDDIGTEYDLTLNWKIYDNLTYRAIAAFLDAGDIWKGGVATEQVEDTYAIFHELSLTF